MKPLMILLALMLCACEDERPPTPTADQSDQLNEAEDLLNGTASGETPANGDIAP